MGLCSSCTAGPAASDPGAAAAGDAAAAAKKGRGIVACGKRTDFGYDKDFEARYSLGKLLGHGQFGYTFAAVDRASSERVAVKRIDKNKVLLCVLRSPATKPSFFLLISFPSGSGGGASRVAGWLTGGPGLRSPCAVSRQLG